MADRSGKSLAYGVCEMNTPTHQEPIKALIEKMRSDNRRFRIVPGGTDVIDASSVDEWADELETHLAEVEAVSPLKKDEDQGSRIRTGEGASVRRVHAEIPTSGVLSPELMARLIESLADYAHEAWSEWMRYLLMHASIGPTARFGDRAQCLVIPSEWHDRWDRQVSTPYANLTEVEKDANRKEARRMIALVWQALEEPSSTNAVDPVAQPHPSGLRASNSDALSSQEVEAMSVSPSNNPFALVAGEFYNFHGAMWQAWAFNNADGWKMRHVPTNDVRRFTVEELRELTRWPDPPGVSSRGADPMTYDFKCENGHTFERNVPSELHYVICTCGHQAERLPCAPNVNVKGGTPTFYPRGERK